MTHEERSYYLRHFRTILEQTGKHKLLPLFLTDFGILKAKLELFDIQELIQDFEGLDDSDLLAIYRSLQLSHDILRNDKSQLWNQLFSRLRQDYLTVFMRVLDSPPDGWWLVSDKDILASPSDPLVTSFQGHDSAIASVTQTLDGEYLVTATTTEIRVWKLSDFTLKFNFLIEGNESGIKSIAAVGKYIVASQDSQLTIWDLLAGAKVDVIKVNQLVGPLIADGNKVIFEANKTFRSLDIVNREQRLLHFLPEQALQITVSKNSLFAIVVDSEGTAMLWDWKQKSPCNVLYMFNNKHPLIYIGISEKNSKAYGQIDVTSWYVPPTKIIRTWKVRKCRNNSEPTIPQIFVEFLRGISSMVSQFLPSNLSVCEISDEGIAFIGTTSGDLLIINTKLIFSRIRIEKAHATKITQLTLLHNHLWIVSTSIDGVIKFWSLQHLSIAVPRVAYGKLLNVIQAGYRSMFNYGKGIVHSLTLTPDGYGLLVGSSENLRMFDIPTLSALIGFKSKNVAEIRMTPNGRYAVTLDKKSPSELKVWNLKPVEGLLSKPQTFPNWLSRFIFKRRIFPKTARNMSQWASKRRSLNPIAKLRITTNSNTDPLKIVAAAISENGEIVAAIYNNSSSTYVSKWRLIIPVYLLLMHRVVTFLSFFGFAPRISLYGSPIKIVDYTPISYLELSIGNSYIYIAENKLIRQINIEDGSETASFQGHSNDVTKIVSAPQCGLVLAGYSNGNISLWSSRSRNVLATLTGHTSPIAYITVTNDGKRALTIAKDGNLKIWDLPSRSIMTSYSGDQRFTAACFVPDSNSFLVGDAAGAIHKFDLVQGKYTKPLHEVAVPKRSVRLSSIAKRLFRPTNLWFQFTKVGKLAFLIFIYSILPATEFFGVATDVFGSTYEDVYVALFLLILVFSLYLIWKKFYQRNWTIHLIIVACHVLFIIFWTILFPPPQ